MFNHVFKAGLLAASVLTLSACGSDNKIARAQVEVLPVVNATPTPPGLPTPSPTPGFGTPTPTSTPTPTATPILVTPTPTATPAPEPTSTPTPVPTATPTPTPRPTATPTPTPRPTVTPTATPRPTVTPTATPRPTVTPTATPRPTVTPTATPRPTITPTPTPNPDFHSCWTPDKSIYIDFYRIVTPFGLRTFVTTSRGQYHVFTKPFCSPTPDLFAAAVSYVNPHYLHVKLPKVQPSPELTGTAYICMGELCPGEKPIVCDPKVRVFFEKICGSHEDLSSQAPEYQRADRRYLEDWIHSHEGKPLR